MSSASSSIETPAWRRRTFDWLSTSLLKGMSREALRVIFGTAFAMLMDSATDGQKTLSRPPIRHRTRRSPLTRIHFPTRHLRLGPSLPHAIRRNRE